MIEEFIIAILIVSFLAVLIFIIWAIVNWFNPLPSFPTSIPSSYMSTGGMGYSSSSSFVTTGSKPGDVY